MKNQRKKRIHIRQTLYIVSGVMCVVVLFGLAMVFPDYYSRLYDKNTLNRIAFTDTDITTYEASYDSFAEKLHAIARGWSQRNGEMRAVRTNELEQGMDQGELTKIVGNELKKLYEYKIIHKKMKPNKKNLVQCERYTIYETKETDGMKGISLWKLVYENTKHKIAVYLDEEYHKIYYVEISYRETKKGGTTIVSEVKSQSKAKDADVYDGSSALSEYFIENHWSQMMQYYDIPPYRAESYDNWVENDTVATVEFDLKYQISFLYDYSLDERKLTVGLPLTKMIQF